MSEEPARYGLPETLTARNALEDTIRAELSPEEIHKLGGLVAYADRENLGPGELFRVLCRVSPDLASVPEELERRIQDRKSGGKVVRPNFGGVQLTDQQNSLLAAVLEGIERRRMVQTVGGLAGTGKTVLIKHLKAELPKFAVCAYTGKAAHVLRKKGVAASTIHAAIYEPNEDSGGVVHWSRRPQVDCKGFLVDESSMVNQQTYDDLLSYDVPLIFVGDHGQLEPIDGSDFNLMKSPQHVLTEIHRNAGPIARFAELLRNDESVRGFEGGDDVQLVRQSILSKSTVLAADQVIVPFNQMRAAYNRTIREALGFADRVESGERIVCLRNNRDEGLFNGMQGVVERVWEDKPRRWLMDFRSDDGRPFRNIWFDPTTFGQDPYAITQKRGTPNPFDWAYAITCHRAQGSEWDTVLVIAKKSKHWEWRRWAYTAASRARETLIWVS